MQSIAEIAAQPGLPVGYRTLDTLTGGVYPTELIVLAGRPGMGKTSSACDMILSVSQTGIPLVFSMEMGQKQLVNRLVTNEARLSYQRVLRDTLEESEKVRLMDAAERLSNRDILIEGASLITPEGVERTLRAVSEQGLTVSCVFLDHLHYMQLSSPTGNLYNDVTAITKYLKALAREYNLPFVLLCQLNRGPEARDDHRPRLSDLRDSGSIEQDADQVWFLYRAGYYEPHSTSTSAELIVAKCRNGPTGIATLHWNAGVMTFSDPPTLADI
jgi:replicative DNA helicase